MNTHIDPLSAKMFNSLSPLQQTSEILSGEYPASQGWKVFRLRLGDVRFFSIVFKFLKNKDIKYYFDGFEDIGEVKLTNKIKKIEETRWYGHVVIDWKDDRIIFYCRIDKEAFGQDTVSIFIIAKSASSVDSLVSELKKYYDEVFKLDDYITIVGEGERERPKCSWDSLILSDDLKENIKNSVFSFFDAKAEFKKFNMAYRRGLLFVGPPGNGKTLASRIISSLVPFHIYILPITADIADNDIKNAFNIASEYSPSVLIIEDIDKLTRNNKVSMSYFLNILDGIFPTEGVLLIGTSNEPEKLDPALLFRPSRFDEVFYFPLPGFSERKKMIQNKSLGLFSESAIEEAARNSEGFTMAYVQEAVVNVFLTSIFKKKQISDEDLLKSVDDLRSQFLKNKSVSGEIRSSGNIGFAELRQ